MQERRALLLLLVPKTYSQLSSGEITAVDGVLLESRLNMNFMRGRDCCLLMRPRVNPGIVETFLLARSVLG